MVTQQQVLQLQRFQRSEIFDILAFKTLAIPAGFPRLFKSPCLIEVFSHLLQEHAHRQLKIHVRVLGGLVRDQSQEVQDLWQMLQLC